MKYKEHFLNLLFLTCRCEIRDVGSWSLLRAVVAHPTNVLGTQLRSSGEPLNWGAIFLSPFAELEKKRGYSNILWNSSLFISFSLFLI